MSTPLKRRRRITPPDPRQFSLPGLGEATHDVYEEQVAGGQGLLQADATSEPQPQALGVRTAGTFPPDLPPLTLIEAFDTDRDQRELLRSLAWSTLDGSVRRMLIQGNPGAVDRVLAFLTRVPGFPTEALPTAVHSLCELRDQLRGIEAVINCSGWATNNIDLQVDANHFWTWALNGGSPSNSIPVCSRPELWLADLSKFVSERLVHIPVVYGVPAPRTPISDIYGEYRRWAVNEPPLPWGVFCALLADAIPPSDTEVSTVAVDVQEFVARHWIVR